MARLAQKKPRKVSKARAKAISEYNKQRRRIAEFVRRAQKRGYRFTDSDIVPPVASSLKDLTTQKVKALVGKLKKETPKELYAKATALSEITGKQVSGEEKRAEERSISARKAARSRKQLQQAAEEDKARRISEEELPEDAQPIASFELTENGWEETQRLRDKENLRKLKEQEEYARQFRQGEVTYNRIVDMINDALASGYKYAAYDLMSELNEQIATYGKDAVMRSIGNAPSELLEDAEIALKYNPGANQHNSSIMKIRQIITGEIPSAEEVANMMDSIEKDSYTDETE